MANIRPSAPLSANRIRSILAAAGHRESIPTPSATVPGTFDWPRGYELMECDGGDWFLVQHRGDTARSLWEEERRRFLREYDEAMRAAGLRVVQWKGALEVEEIAPFEAVDATRDVVVIARKGGDGSWTVRRTDPGGLVATGPTVERAIETLVAEEPGGFSGAEEITLNILVRLRDLRGSRSPTPTSSACGSMPER